MAKKKSTEPSKKASKKKTTTQKGKEEPKRKSFGVPIEEPVSPKSKLASCDAKVFMKEIREAYRGTLERDENGDIVYETDKKTGEIKYTESGVPIAVPAKTPEMQDEAMKDVLKKYGHCAKKTWEFPEYATRMASIEEKRKIYQAEIDECVEGIEGDASKKEKVAVCRFLNKVDTLPLELKQTVIEGLNLIEGDD